MDRAGGAAGPCRLRSQESIQEQATSCVRAQKVTGGVLKKTSYCLELKASVFPT